MLVSAVPNLGPGILSIVHFVQTPVPMLICSLFSFGGPDKSGSCLPVLPVSCRDPDAQLWRRPALAVACPSNQDAVRDTPLCSRGVHTEAAPVHSGAALQVCRDGGFRRNAGPLPSPRGRLLSASDLLTLHSHPAAGNLTRLASRRGHCLPLCWTLSGCDRIQNTDTALSHVGSQTKHFLNGGL